MKSTEGGHVLSVPDVEHDDSDLHPPDTTDDGQPGPGYQSAAPQVNRPPGTGRCPAGMKTTSCTLSTRNSITTM
jgi:hypothetical protein